MRKFSGPLDIPWSSLSTRWQPRARTGSRWSLVGQHAPFRACYIARNSWVAAAALRAHRSQWVWFRRLFLCMSRYTYVNTLYPLSPRHSN